MRQQLLQPHEYTEEEEEDGGQAAANQITLVAQCVIGLKECPEGVTSLGLSAFQEDELLGFAGVLINHSNSIPLQEQASITHQ